MDDQESILKKARELLEAFGMTVVTVTSTAEALQVINSTNINLALIDWRLRHHDDGIRFGRSLRRDHGIPFVLFSGYLDTEATGHAYKQGASDVIDKPLRAGRLLAAVELALQPADNRTHSNRNAPTPTVGSHSTSGRLARVVLRACQSPEDPNTEPAVAAAGGVSTSVFRKLCDGCDIAGRDVRDLTRFMRALARAQEDGSTIRNHLAIFDPRTWAALFQRAGLSLDSRFVPLRSFFLNQRFLPSSNDFLRELAHLAANDPLFFIEPDEERTGTEGV